MVLGDLDAVADLEAELFGKGKWSRAMFVSELHAPWRHYIVAVPAGDPETILGYAGIALGESAQVMTIGVAPAARRQGIGRRLLTDLLREAEEHGSREAILEVRVDAEAPQAMYRKFGFIGIGVRKNYYQAEGIDALVMKKNLGPQVGPVGSEATS